MLFYIALHSKTSTGLFLVLLLLLFLFRLEFHRWCVILKVVGFSLAFHSFLFRVCFSHLRFYSYSYCTLVYMFLLHSNMSLYTLLLLLLFGWGEFLLLLFWRASYSCFLCYVTTQVFCFIRDTRVSEKVVVVSAFEIFFFFLIIGEEGPVSYTHLTLPTMAVV